MAMRPTSRPPVGSSAWCADERSSALDITQSEVEEFGYSARNEVEWLNEHMADIFSENQINVADIFKTPGKLRGKTPHTARKLYHNENRVPLSDIFSATPKGAPNPFTTPNLLHARTPNFTIAEDEPGSPAGPASITRDPVLAEPAPQQQRVLAHSGYYGSQSQDVATDFDEVMEDAESVQAYDPVPVREEPGQTLAGTVEEAGRESPATISRSLEDCSQEEQVVETSSTLPAGPPAPGDLDTPVVQTSSPVQLLGHDSLQKSPARSPTPESQPQQPEPPIAPQQALTEHMPADDTADDDGADVTRSPSDGSSPIRPLVRKSSLNFASLPAREPLTSNKSIGARMSRTSHIEPTRTSYYPRPTGGKSLGVRQDALDADDDVMDIDNDGAADVVEEKKDSAFATHSRSYTQRLQDQISMLGKSQAGGPRPSKSIANLSGPQQPLHSSLPQIPQPAQAAAEEKPRSPPQPQQSARTPGAFPEDDEDDWIAPPPTDRAVIQSPRPALEKSYTADIMEGVHRSDTVSGIDSNTPEDQLQETSPNSTHHSPQRPALFNQVKPAFGHGKSVSVPDLGQHNIFGDAAGQDLKKVVSASNPLVDDSKDAQGDGTPNSPSRSFRESPLRQNTLKQVKNKFSSILKGSKGLLASSAALSADGKASLMNSPSAPRLQNQDDISTEPLPPGQEEKPLYPDLTKHMSESHHAPRAPSPVKSNARKTRASAERERRDQKQKDKEDKEAQRLAEQMEKLEKAREKERERARVLSKEKQEKASPEEPDGMQQESRQAMRTPAPKEANRPTRTSPRKGKAQVEAGGRAAAEPDELGLADQDAEMADAPAARPVPPSIPRLTPGQGLKNREIKRPTKPTRETAVKPKQAPTLIRVNTSSQHSGLYPSNSTLASSLQDTLGSSQQQIKGKASQPSLQTKSSLQNLKSSVNTTTGRPKALELAEKRRQEEEKKTQRKREFKAELERKREKEQKQEAERREKERQRAAAQEEAKKQAARQVAIEKAKKTKAPPPAVRSQPSGPPDHNPVREKAAIPRPPSRLQQSTMYRSQEDIGRPVNAVLSSTAKMSMKRPLQQEGGEDTMQRSTAARNGPAPQKEVKRMRISDDEFDAEEEMEIQSYGTGIKAQHVGPSAGLKKDQPNKSLFASGYATGPQGVTRDIFKAPPVAAHHSKSGHPLDMAQVSKGPIPFASSQHGAGASHKTPARPAGVMAAKSTAKSATRSSPRFQNGENIELPEIQTDDDDDDDDDDEAKGLGIASWADTPELRRELMKQESIDPLQVFGPPAPLRLEEVFKNKDRWSKFRARGSSANWNGGDRLTEDEIRKDLAAREKMRRDGGWSYELSKDIQ